MIENRYRVFANTFETNISRELFFIKICVLKLVQRSYDFVSLLLKLIKTDPRNFIDACNNISNERSLKFIKNDVKLDNTFNTFLES